MVDWNQKITSLGLTWGQGAGTSGDTGLGHGVGLGQVAGGIWGGFNGHGGWDWDMGGFGGQAWWIRTRESDLQGLTWGHGTGTRVRLLGTTG